jgi:hypothetical protein
MSAPAKKSRLFEEVGRKPRLTGVSYRSLSAVSALAYHRSRAIQLLHQHPLAVPLHDAARPILPLPVVFIFRHSFVIGHTK